MRAIGRADLTQTDPALAHHVRDAKRAANLDELSARYHCLFAIGERVQRQQHCGGVVVDHRRPFSPGQCQEVRFDHLVPVSTAAFNEVVL